MAKDRLSIIIPTFNERRNIPELLDALTSDSRFEPHEILVIDSAESTDNCKDIDWNGKAKLIHSAKAGRAHQLHEGAQIATGDVFYFIHADTRPPKKFAQHINDFLDQGHDFGLFSYRFDSDSRVLAINASTTKKIGVWTGGGDQGLFIKRDSYFEHGGYDCSLPIMEDFDLYWRLAKNNVPHGIVDQTAIISARKYEANSYFKVNIINMLVFWGFKFGIEPARLKRFYSKSLNQ